MKLFTNQSRDFVIDLANNGFIKNNGTLFRNESYVRNAYDELLKYVNGNIKNIFNDYPIWCWYKIDEAIPNDGIRIELEVPDDMVILMDYYDWGGGVLYHSKVYLDKLRLGEPTKSVMCKIIQDIENSLNPDIFRDDIQAIIPYIKLEWVTNLEEILEGVE